MNFAVRAGVYDWCIPEYHDDQRLHDGNSSSNDYGPVAHTFAFPRVGQLLDHTDYDGHYINVAIVDLDEVLASMPSPYTDLKLTTLHSCLYLQHHDPFIGKSYFTAMMLSASGTTCATNPTEDPAQMLDVKLEKFSEHDGDYPPVSRFIEGNGGRTLIGVMCTNRWCVVGANPIGSIPHSAHHGTGTPSRVSDVKGWFDDQILGVPDATPNYRIHRKVRASLIPDMGLGSLSIAIFKTGYQHVADAFFPVAPPEDSKYVTKYGFHQGYNPIEMIAKDTVNSGGVPYVKWTARINGVAKEFKVDRTDHSLFGLTSVPATARFRWKDTDEDVWVACDIGCCLVNGDIY